MRIPAARLTFFLLGVALTTVTAECFMDDSAHLHLSPVVASSTAPEALTSHAS